MENTQDKYYTLRSELTQLIFDFKKACDEDGRNFEEEFEDCVTDSQRL